MTDWRFRLLQDVNLWHTGHIPLDHAEKVLLAALEAAAVECDDYADTLAAAGFQTTDARTCAMRIRAMKRGKS